MDTELLTTEELAKRIKYDVRTIRERMLDSVLVEGVHYFRPFGGRKILYIWEAIRKDMMVAKHRTAMMPKEAMGIRMANGGVLHG